MGIGHRNRGPGTLVLLPRRKYRDQQLLQRTSDSCGRGRRGRHDECSHARLSDAGAVRSVELKPRDNPEFIGQAYGAVRASVPALRLDALGLDRIDLIKIDVEGMELDVLEGARASIERHHPILTVETIKTDFDRLAKLLAELNYQLFQLDRINIAAIHRSDKTASHIKSA
jgi:Methyltransferase FkbM domain